MGEAIVVLLESLSALAMLKNGGQNNDLTRLMQLAAAGARTAQAGKTGLEEATAKVQQLVDEDRGLTDAENAAVDASIEAKLDAIAKTEINDAPEDPQP